MQLLNSAPKLSLLRVEKLHVQALNTSNEAYYQREATLPVPVSTIGGQREVDSDSSSVELVSEPLRDRGFFWQNLGSIRPLLIS
jgi:hypothetical protein